MTPEDRNWELAGQARMDGDREAERIYMNRARGLPDDHGVLPPACWACGHRTRTEEECNKVLWTAPATCLRNRRPK
jgi:hypothetical protein